jgi:hypothetical protein
MYGLSMINQLNEYLNVTTVMTVWIRKSINQEFTTLKNNFATSRCIITTSDYLNSD